MSKFSIIIPIYNAQKYLTRAIDSVLAQTFSDYEVILVNDGSTDASSEICELYEKKDARIKYIYKNNEGVSVARNVGMEMANGEYIGFLDADDMLEVDCLEKVAGCLEVENRIELIAFDVFLNTPSKKWVRKGCIVDNGLLQRANFGDIFVIYNDESESYLQKIATYTSWNKFYRNEFIKQNYIRFEKGIYSGEDFLFCLEIWGLVKKVAYIEVPLYNYMFNEDSCIHQGAHRKVEIILNNQQRIYKACRELIKKNNLPSFYFIPCANGCIHSIYSICESLHYNIEYKNLSLSEKNKKLDLALSSYIFLEAYKSYNSSSSYILSKGCRMIMAGRKGKRPSLLYIWAIFYIRELSKMFRTVF